MTFEFVISRAGIPVPADGSAGNDELDWDWAVAWPFAALASPGSAARMPALPDLRTSEPNSAALGYWNCLAYLLTYSLGWARHDRGLRWWYDAGKPTDDPRLALVSSVWELDGSLDRYVEWVHEHPSHVPGGFVDSASSASHLPDKDEISPVWQARLREIRLNSQSSSGPSSTPQPHGFHLEWGTHTDHPVKSTENLPRVLIDPEHPLHAVLIVPTLSGWYETLRKAGTGLIHSTGSSQRVSVYVTSDGFLGTYRRSWQTGLWFAGKHQYHTVGN